MKSKIKELHYLIRAYYLEIENYHCSVKKIKIKERGNKGVQEAKQYFGRRLSKEAERYA